MSKGKKEFEEKGVREKLKTKLGRDPTDAEVAEQCMSMYKARSVVTWGDYFDGGDSRSVKAQLAGGVQHVSSTNYAFAAVKEGGGADPVANTQLARVLADAARLSVPKDLVDRNIKRATDGSQADFMELTYEAYGAGGVGIVIEVLSDNVNRAAADTKAAINKNGGKVAEPGSVLFNFERKGVISVDCAADKEDEVFEIAAENGGDDIVPREDGGEGFEVITEVAGFMQCQSALADAGFAINPDETALKMIPLAPVDVDDEAAEANEALVEKLLELDDVDAVYTQ